MKTIYINTLEQVAELFFEQVYYEKEERYRSPFLYRGMPNAKFKLMTSLERNCKGKKKELERPILRNFAKYATILFFDCFLQRFGNGQHGLGTELFHLPVVGQQAVDFILHVADLGIDRRA